ncbi:MAG: type II 3-dehydroquinate dehydratase [Paracoccus sp. (in: a-proteobacteria)]|nr:type II 3-dehydroquinate dehydratase [Paracoccus sp. (in: a-proteobacteria)]
MMKTILLLNGPNLNLLGQRQPALYGHDTLADVEGIARAACAEGFSITAQQSNWEGQLIDWIHEARGNAVGIVINPGGLSHTSVALLDALNAFDGPVIEVHISQIHKREPFRHHSFVSSRADAVIAGLGIDGYAAAVGRICKLLG